MDKLFVMLGALSAAIAVGAGAFGAHALRARLEPRMLEVFETGARYQMYHALALIAVAWAASRWPGSLTTASGWLFVAGTLLFSGSLYVMALTGVRALGAVTPLGGVCFIAGWVCVALAAGRSAESQFPIRDRLSAICYPLFPYRLRSLAVPAVPVPSGVPATGTARE